MESGFKMCGVRLAVLALFCVSIVASLQPPSLNEPPREEGEEDSLFVVNRFTDNINQTFRHIAVDQFTGSVYAAGINRLYQLDANLKVLHTVITGPVNDSTKCSPSGCKGHEDKMSMKLTDNFNTVLLLDHLRASVIVCGSVKQGSCQVRDLRNITVLTRNVSKPIASNDASKSTVAFIAPGPKNPKLPVSHVLYIGVTYTEKSVYRDKVPAVASLSLEDEKFFETVFSNGFVATKMHVNSLVRRRYPIDYVYGFSSGNFSYFLTRQRQSLEKDSPFISKLVRVCQNDYYYYSYTEVPLECRDSSGKSYNLVQAAYLGKAGIELSSQLGIQLEDDVLFAVFSTSEYGGTSKIPAQESALCVYSIKAIQTKFLYNIQECAKGNGERGLDFISPSRPCIKTPLDLEEDWCGINSPLNTPLGGVHPIEGVALLNFPFRLTAVATTITETYTVLYFGTINGHLKKVVVGDQNNTLEYGDITVDEGFPVKQDMIFDKEGDHLYVVTANKISKVKTHECSIYKGCDQCLGALDPFCGWCTMENKCSLKRDCQDTSRNSEPWMSYKQGRCTTIISVHPSNLQRTTARTLKLHIENLPLVNGSLQCVFESSGKMLPMNAKRTAQGVQCTTPRNDFLPDIPHQMHYFTSLLSVREISGPKLVSTNFTFFDCSLLTSCTGCVSSAFPCDWCVDGNRCTHDSAENCRNDILVSGVERIGPTIRSGPSFCPRMTAIESQEILVHNGMLKSIKVKLNNIAQFILQTHFVCQFNIQGRVTSVNAQFLSDTIYCDDMEFDYRTASPSMYAGFSVIWGNRKALDNPDDIHVLMYKCQQMAENCGQCLILPERYQCGWCQSSLSCEVEENCAASRAWLHRNATCPNPKVSSFHPQSGPWEGGTNVTIKGINLGKRIEDIREGITVAGIPCTPFEESYVPTEQVSCEMAGPQAPQNREGPIIVKVADEFRGDSLGVYKFVNPRLLGVSPRAGPRFGGNVVYIEREHMDAGSRVTATIAGSPCLIIRTNATHVACRTHPSPKVISGVVTVTFDNGYRELEQPQFSYVDDPVIFNVRGGCTNHLNVPCGIVSGGTRITVNGTGFSTISETRMYVVFKETDFISSCTIKDDNRIECDTPLIVGAKAVDIDPENGIELDYGFIMDGVRLHMPHEMGRNYHPFQLIPNPSYYPFPDDEMKQHKLLINGHHLNSD